jgi:Ca2+-binding EF-hand superfamily protein
LGGLRSLIELQSNFNGIDTDKSGLLDLNEFKAAILALRIEVTEFDVKEIFDIFDLNKDGGISYLEFLSTIRGALTSQRKQIVEKAFQSV